MTKRKIRDEGERWRERQGGGQRIRARIFQMVQLQFLHKGLSVFSSEEAPVSSSNHIELTLTESNKKSKNLSESMKYFFNVCVYTHLYNQSNRNLMVQINQLIIMLSVLMVTYINLGASYVSKFILLVVITWVDFIANSLTCHKKSHYC